MRLTTKLLKKIIKEELQKMNEMQVYDGSGLSHGFNDLELSGKIYDEIEAYEQSGDDANLRALRETALERYRKLNHAISQSDGFELENLKQKLVFLDDATDALDHALKLYKKNVRYSPGHPMEDHGLSPEGWGLERRADQRSAKANKAYHKEFTKGKGW